jgi:hypothetical protein
MGGTLGTAVFLSILFSNAATKIPAAYHSAQTDPAFLAAAKAHPDQLRQIQSGGSLNDTSFLHSLAAPLAHPFRAGFSSAMDLVFLVGAGVLVLAFVLALALKEVPLRTVSGQQARAAARAVPQTDTRDSNESGIPGVPASVAGSEDTVVPTAPR